MDVTRDDQNVVIKCTANELADILEDLWAHNMGMCKARFELTALAKNVNISPGWAWS